MKVREMFPSRYLKGSELPGEVTVTIKGIVSERMYKPGSGEVSGWVLYCEKASRGVVLSKGLALTIAQALGEDDTDQWIGQKVVFFPQPMRVGGRDLVVIRAKGCG